jgi:hypothetical protein
MGKTEKRSRDYIYSNEMESGVQYTFIGYDDSGKSMWRLPYVEKGTRVRAEEAGLREFRQKGISVKEGITKKLPGNWKPGTKNKGGWRLDG